MNRLEKNRRFDGNEVRDRRCERYVVMRRISIKFSERCPGLTISQDRQTDRRTSDKMPCTYTTNAALIASKFILHLSPLEKNKIRFDVFPRTLSLH